MYIGGRGKAEFSFTLRRGPRRVLVNDGGYRERCNQLRRAPLAGPPGRSVRKCIQQQRQRRYCP